MAVLTIAPLGAGCRGIQSALDPAGPAAAAIAQVWWLMAIGATLVLAAVMGLLWYVLSRRQDADFTHGKRVIVIGGLLVPSLVLGALLVHGTWLGRTVMAMDAPVAHVVEVEARQWFWTFHYLDSNGTHVASTRNMLALPRGRTVEFRVTSRDVIHSFWVPRLGGKIDVIPGRTNTLRLRADAAGRMRGQCAEFCGLEHARMAFDVVVLAPSEFDAWLADGGREPLVEDPPAALVPAVAVPGAERSR